VRNPSYRRIFDRSFGISFFAIAIAIVNWILSYWTTSVAHKLGLAGTNIEFGLVLGCSVASIFIASKLVKVLTAYGGSIKGRPPLNAHYLFYLFLDAQNCDALVGDLEERYRLIRKKFGQRRANFWYWTQAIRSVGPIAWAWMKKVALKPVIGFIAWAVAKGLVGHDSWLAALVEVWRRIRL
jgi:hypothetical protein